VRKLKLILKKIDLLSDANISIPARTNINIICDFFKLFEYPIIYNKGKNDKKNEYAPIEFLFKKSEITKLIINNNGKATKNIKEKVFIWNFVHVTLYIA